MMSILTCTFQRLSPPPTCASCVENLHDYSSSKNSGPSSPKQLATHCALLDCVQTLHRLPNRCEQHNVLSPSQKGFTPHDRILEYNFLRQQSLKQARLHRKELCIAWLHVTNAFGALPHSAIFEALSSAGTGHQFVDVIKDIYSDSSTQILSGPGTTNPIAISSGVKQGCPISGFLFNLCIDPVISSVQENSDSHRILRLRTTSAFWPPPPPSSSPC
ncbi:hypothetical protein AVEN_80832-1 [Araneus ventricosus]|uniref:Reverse transcriptase domain-containing protein n=1 Tax=Araneus ventricosus TaxID=182803 RepID=A0A4Y2NX64_ARAVE|nr:hypothetical protein AVEN_80832-1 [Araneus ventricosus]